MLIIVAEYKKKLKDYNKLKLITKNSYMFTNKIYNNIKKNYKIFKNNLNSKLIL